MALETPRDLFIHQLGSMRDAERTGAQMLGWIAGHVDNPELAQMLQAQERDSHQQLANISSCFHALGGTPLETASTTVEGIRSGFQAFAALQPSPPVLDLFVIDTARRFMSYSIASYSGLVDWAVIMNEVHCAENLFTNLVQKQEAAGMLTRIGHELSERLLAAAPA